MVSGSTPSVLESSKPMFPSQLFITPEAIAVTVLMLIRPDRDTSADANGTFIPASRAFWMHHRGETGRQTVWEYFHEQPEFRDLAMRWTMQAMDVEHQWDIRLVCTLAA